MPKKQPDVLITPERLALLEKKERAHDDYMAGLRSVREKAARYELTPFTGTPFAEGQQAAYVSGYRKALKDFALSILEASSSRHAA